MLANAVRGGTAGFVTSRTMPQTKEAGSFSAALESFMKEKRTAQNTVAGDDPITIRSRAAVGWDYQEKLDYLAKLNAETDWGSMTDVEKVRTFEDRYREMFGRESLSYLFNHVTKRHEDVYDGYLSEKSKYFYPEGLAGLKSPYQECYRKAYYENVPEDELRAAIREKYQGNDSMESKYLTLDEYSRVGVGTSVDRKVQDHIKYQIYRQAEAVLRFLVAGTGMCAEQHPRYEHLFMSFAKGIDEGAVFRPGWSQITSGVMESYQNADPEYRMSEAELEQLQRELDEFLNEIMK